MEIEAGYCRPKFRNFSIFPNFLWRNGGEFSRMIDVMRQPRANIFLLTIVLVIVGLRGRALPDRNAGCGIKPGGYRDGQASTRDGG